MLMVRYAARSHSVDVICGSGWQRFRWELSGLFGTDLNDKALCQVSFPRLSDTIVPAALKIEQEHHAFHFEPTLSQ